MDGGWMDIVTMNGWLQVHWFNVLEVLSEFGTYYSIKLGSLLSNSSINYFPDFFFFFLSFLLNFITYWRFQ